MKACPKCGFLNPDRAEYCIKCRFLMTRVEQAQSTGPQPGPESGTDKPDIMGPPPDLDDRYERRGDFDVGGYEIGGVAPGRETVAPPPSDAHGLMVSGEALSPGTDRIKRGKRARKSRGRGRPAKTAGRDDLPPEAFDMSPAPFAPGEVRPPSRPQGRAKRRPAGKRPPRRGAHVRGAPGGAPPGPFVQGPTPMSPGDVFATRTGPQPGAAGPAVKRPSLPKPDFSFLSGIKNITSKHVLTAVAVVMSLFALVYVAAGGNYFARPDQEMLGRAAAAMRSLSSVHWNAEEYIDSEKLGSVRGLVQVDVSRNSDYHAVYTLNTPEGPSVYQLIKSSGKTYELMGNGPWAKAGSAYNVVDFSSGAIFKDASGIKLIDRQPVDGVPCDHLSFIGGRALARSFFPKAEIGTGAQARVDVWTDLQQYYIRHLQLKCTGLTARGLRTFNCRVEVGYSNFGAQIDIRPPI